MPPRPALVPFRVPCAASSLTSCLFPSSKLLLEGLSPASAPPASLPETCACPLLRVPFQWPFVQNSALLHRGRKPSSHAQNSQTTVARFLLASEQHCRFHSPAESLHTFYLLPCREPFSRDSSFPFPQRNVSLPSLKTDPSSWSRGVFLVENCPPFSHQTPDRPFFVRVDFFFDSEKPL